MFKFLNIDRDCEIYEPTIFICIIKRKIVLIYKKCLGFPERIKPIIRFRIQLNIPGKVYIVMATIYIKKFVNLPYMR